MQKYFHYHLLSEGHKDLINDVEIVFIYKTDPSDPARREEFWRNKLKNLAPYGLIWKNSLQVCIFFGAVSDLDILEKLPPITCPNNSILK